MNGVATWTAAWHLLGALAVEVILIVGAATVMQRIINSVLWHRTVWQISMLSVGMLLVGEATGASQGFSVRVAMPWQLAARVWRPSAAKTVRPNENSVVNNLSVRESFRNQVADQMAFHRQAADGELIRHQIKAPVSASDAAREGAGLSPLAESSNAESGRTILKSQAKPIATITKPRAKRDWPEENREDLFSNTPPVLWIGLVWILGIGVVAARIGLVRFLFLMFRRRCSICHVALRERVRTLAEPLGLRHGVRLIESAQLRGPIAFGVLRPTIGLPLNFTKDFSNEQQDAMLVHELAHLAAHDPAWHLLTDILTALLWWHPFVWWARYQLGSATEAAADEASLLITDGPAILAECLVKLGGRMLEQRSLGWMGIEGSGYRSALGRRVERLFGLTARPPRPPRALRHGLAKILGPAALAAIAIVCAGWTNPQTQGETMRMLRQSWKRTIATLALATALAPENSATLAADAPKPADSIGNGSANLEKPRSVERSRQTGPLSKPNPAPTAENKEKIRAKLEWIVLQEVFYDAIPLNEVVKDLREEARKRDPEKRGINFLISNALEAAWTVDPTSGATVPVSIAGAQNSPQPPPIELKQVRVRLDLALRNVRMKDVLDVITKVAERPIHYTVEDYGVVFSAGAPPPKSGVPAIESENSSQFKMDSELMKRYGMLPPKAPTSTQPPAQAARKASKLETIVLNEVFFDGLPLSEVAKFLYAESRKLDPENQGVNFVINPNSPARFGGIDPSTGQPLPAPEPVDLNNVIVKFNLPLRNVRLKDVLDAITKVAEKPVTYSVEDYGVIFATDSNDSLSPSPAGRPYGLPPYYGYGAVFQPQRTDSLEVRTFRVDTNTFLKGLESAFGITVGELTYKTPFDAEKQQIELSLAEKELAETTKKFQAAVVPQSEFEKTKAAVELLKATNETERVQIRLRLAEQELRTISRMVENGTRPTLDFDRATAAKQMLELELKTLENGPSVLQKTSAMRMNQSREAQDALRRLLAQFGVDVETELGFPDIAPNVKADTRTLRKTIFYNGLTGIIMVRATAEDMKIVEAVIETLGGTAKVESRPEATVESKHTVTVLGSVHKPGIFDLPSAAKWGVLDAIAAAGGFKDSANKSRIEISRKGSNRNTLLKFEEIKRTTDPEKIFWLEPGDMIHVHESIF